MKKKRAHQASVSQKKSSILLVSFFIIFAFLILGSISLIQQNTRPKNFAEDITPILRCGSPCSYNAQCPHQLFCYNGSCRNPQCKNMEDCACIMTPTLNPYASTRRPSAIAKNSITSTPQSPTVTPTRSTTPSVIVIISPYPTEDPNPTPTEAPLFEIDKEVPRNKTIFDRFFDFVVNLFCRIFGC